MLSYLYVTRWDDAVEPYDTAAHRESLPVAPHVLLSSFQNSAADSVIEDVIEVSQQLCSIADPDPFVMKTRKHRIDDQGCHCLTIIFLKGRLETAEESECRDNQDELNCLSACNFLTAPLLNQRRKQPIKPKELPGFSSHKDCSGVPPARSEGPGGL